MEHAGAGRCGAVTPSRLPPYVKLHEPQLLFAADQDGAQDAHPLRGVLEYGPYTRRAFAQFTPKIRIATVGPPSGRDRVRALLTALRQAHAPGDRKEYVPPYPGFERLFGVGIAPAPPEAHLPLPESLSDLPGEGSATSRVVAALSDAIRRLEVVRDSFDVATFHLPDNWGPALRGDGFDAHDELKALGALYGIPTQVLNDRVFVFPYLASRSWRLGLAIYVKAGGVPWKIAPLPGIPDATAYIGLAYALRGDPRDARFVACCSQVFDSDGGGMRFVAYDARDPIDDTWEARHNPYLSRDDMQAVMSRSLREYQSRNGGEVPRRVVIYKTTAFRDDEIAGAADALEAVRELECIEITTAVAWRGAEAARLWCSKRGGRLPGPSRDDGSDVGHLDAGVGSRQRTSGRRTRELLPGGQEHPSAAAPGPPCRCGPAGARRHGGHRAHEDELEQRRVVRPGAGHRRLRQAPRSHDRQCADAPKKRVLVPSLHVKQIVGGPVPVASGRLNIAIRGKK
jgi:hypothetical protein